MARSMTVRLKDKTDAECRELAAHYLRRAIRAEKREEETTRLLRETLDELSRLRNLASQMVGE